MNAQDKLVQRLKACPSDYEWKELQRLLGRLGYKEHQGSGSRVRFSGEGLPKINLHKPHPSPIMKQYAVRQVCEILEDAGLI